MHAVALAALALSARAGGQPVAQGPTPDSTTLVRCAADADSVERAWSHRWHVTHSHTVSADVAAMDTARANQLRPCLAGVRPESLGTHQLPRLVTLDAQAFAWPAADSIAELYVTRAGSTAAAQGAALLELMQAMLLAPDRSLAHTRIRSYSERIDALGSTATPQAIAAHVWLAQMADSMAGTIREARLALVLGNCLSPGERLKAVDPIARAYNFLVESYGNSFEPDSAKIFAERGMAAMTALGFTPADTTRLFFWAHVVAQTAQRYALIGTPAPVFSRGHWINPRGASTTFPPHKGIGLVEFTADWCAPCRESYPTLIRLHEAYAARGLHLVLGTNLSVEFSGKKLSRPAWMAAAERYFVGEAHIPFPIHVDTPDSVHGAPIDSATAANSMLSYVQDAYPTTRRYVVQGIPQLVLIDRSGIIRQIVTGWDAGIAAKLKTNIDALLTEPDTAVAASGGHRPTPAAKAPYDRATTLLQRHDTTGALAALRRAIEADPDYLAAHSQFIHVSELKLFVRDDSDDARTELSWKNAIHAIERQYAAWSSRFPKSAGVAFGMGSALYDAEDPGAKPYLLRAIRLDPTLAAAYADLSIDAERWGDDAQAREYERKAAAADPANPDYAFYYAWDIKEVDPDKWQGLVQMIVRRFPTNERGAQALSWLARLAPKDSEAFSVRIYEQLRAQYPPALFPYWSGGGMERLFEIETGTAPDKALALAQDMLAVMPKPEDQATWGSRLVYARNLVLVQALVAQRQFAAASAVLSATRYPEYARNPETFAILKAAIADSAGSTRMAYDSTLAIYAAGPSDSERAALVRYGAKLGKSAARTDSDAWAIRDTAAKPAPAFKLAAYASHDSIALADYRGKIVLLTFWFPGCGPCRGEFPHFQKVVNEFNGRGLAYVGVNVSPSQDAYVLPFMRGTRYTFTPLREDATIEKAYKIIGEPANFLIDTQGRVVYRDFEARDAEGERTLELMIESMLDHTASAVATGR
jgi:thiol-disulfide isomerase/thioredoxin